MKAITQSIDTVIIHDEKIKQIVYIQALLITVITSKI